MSTLISVAAFAACVSPTAPSPASTQCLAGKVPYASCVNKDYINPFGDYINPFGDYINPFGDDSTKTGG